MVFYRPIDQGVEIIRVLYGARDIAVLMEHESNPTRRKRGVDDVLEPVSASRARFDERAWQRDLARLTPLAVTDCRRRMVRCWLNWRAAVMCLSQRTRICATSKTSPVEPWRSWSCPPIACPCSYRCLVASPQWSSPRLLGPTSSCQTQRAISAVILQTHEVHGQQTQHSREDLVSHFAMHVG